MLVATWCDFERSNCIFFSSTRTCRATPKQIVHLRACRSSCVCRQNSLSYHDVCVLEFSFSSEEVHLCVSVLRRPGRANEEELSGRFNWETTTGMDCKGQMGGWGICNIRLASRTGDPSFKTSAKVPGSYSLLWRVFVAVLLFIACSFRKERRDGLLWSWHKVCAYIFGCLHHHVLGIFMRLHVQPRF
ncbi:unnamed protein product [Ixodes hexagonus]